MRWAIFADCMQKRCAGIHCGIQRFARIRRLAPNLLLSLVTKVAGTGMRATIKAEPEAVALDLTRTALIIIDMQRDFLEPGGFGETLGNDVSLLGRAVAPCRSVLEAARRAGMLVIHTREGHRPDLSDAPKAKLERGKPSMRIGDPGPMGRILIRGEAGHDIIPDLYPLAGEPVIDKPGKGAFYATDLDALLRNFGIQHLLVCGVTTEVCVNTTVREANDRGYRCVVLADCCASYFPEFHEMGLAMVKAQGAIFGWVSDSVSAVAALTKPALKLVST
jgi:nicotinamidase-related amidase